MKRLASLLVFSCLTPLLWTEQQAPEPVEFNKITDRLYETSGGRGARGGVYIGEDGVLVIDAKMDEATVDQIVDGIRKLSDKPIKFLVDTHSDGDHIWGNQFFPPGVTIVAHENCRKEFFHAKRDGSPSDWNDPKLAAYLPAVTYKDKMDLYLGSKKVELWHFGVGHTKGDSVVYFPEEKIAFVADQIFMTRPQLIHDYKGGNSFGHVKNLTRMLETLDAQQFYNGHGERADREAIKMHIAQMKERQKKVKALVDAGEPLEDVKAEFSEEEGRLVEVIYNEIKEKRTD